MKELPKRGDKVRLGKSVCVVLSKQGNDFIARNDEGNLVGFDKHSPFTIVERKQEQKSEAEEAISLVEDASAEGELEKADEVTDSSSAFSKEGDTSKEEPKKENVSGIMDLLFGSKKKKED